jgi:hypothetical protein
MATTKKSPKLLTAGRWHPSVRRFIIFGSFAVNIAFVVLALTFASTNVLDGVIMPNGLVRYCASANDDKFKDSADRVKALRDYVCDRPEPTQYFHEGFNKYLDTKGIPHTTKE